MSLDGLHRRAIALVSYEGDEWWHERAILGFVGSSGVCVATPHWDIYVESAADYESMRCLGERGGGIPVAIRRTGRIVRFDRAVLAQRWEELIGQALQGEPEMREHQEPEAKGDDSVWVAIESRAGLTPGTPVDTAKWKVHSFGDRGVGVQGDQSVSLAKVGSWQAPVVVSAPE